MSFQTALAHLCDVAVRVFYRLELAGPPVPGSGPLLLVANHPNALLDPALVIAAAGRPVRFLGKSTLFTDRRIGWLVRRAGAIPVYRRVDDPTQMGRNVDAFTAVFEALADGDAVGIFPEGISHSEPSLAELRTGAARIALGAHREGSGRGEAPFPIVPVGLVLDRKERFRSRALVLRGEPVEWRDLAPRGGEDRAAVRELTARIGRELRQVTVNLERWEDRPLVETVEEVWSGERDAAGEPAEQLARIEVIVERLAELRRRAADGGDAEPSPEHAGLPPGAAADLARQVLAHRRRLRALGLQPSDLTAASDLRAGLAWTARRLWVLGPPAALLDWAGYGLFWAPYHSTGWLVRRLRLPVELLSTYKLLVGLVVYAVWVAVLTAVAGLAGGPWAALAALVGVPAVGLWGLWLRERRRDVRRYWRRLLRLRGRRRLAETLRADQRRIADRLEELYRGGAAADRRVRT